MPIFIDESGDSGIGQKSSPTFTLAAVLFETDEGAEACARAVVRLGQELGVREFHFVDLTEANRRNFLQAVREYEFRYVVQTVVKERVVHKKLWRKKAFFYERVAEKLAAGVEEWLRLAQKNRLPKPLNAKIVADRNGDPEYMQALKKHLRIIKDEHGRSLVGKVTSHRSISSPLVQLADMVCGAIRHRGYEKIIEGKRLQVLEWP